MRTSYNYNYTEESWQVAKTKSFPNIYEERNWIRSWKLSIRLGIDWKLANKASIFNRLAGWAYYGMVIFYLITVKPQEASLNTLAI